MKNDNSLKAILKSLNAVRSEDNTRKFMCECYLDKTEGESVLVSTDGRMMVMFTPKDGVLALADIPQGYVRLDEKLLQILPIKLAETFPLWRRVKPAPADYVQLTGFGVPDRYMGSADILALFVKETGILLKYEYVAKIAFQDGGVTSVHKDERCDKAVCYKAETAYGTYEVLIMPYGKD